MSDALLQYVVGPSIVALFGLISVMMTKGVRILRRNTASTKLIEQQTSAIRDQVENSHNTNLREELDEQKDKMIKMSDTLLNMRDDIDQLKFDQKHTRRDIGGIRQDLRAIRALVFKLTETVVEDDHK